jgi:DNA-binding beta-propeller fold protein YncE
VAIRRSRCEGEARGNLKEIITSVPIFLLVLGIGYLASGIPVNNCYAVENYQFEMKWGSSGTANGQFNDHWGIAVDSSGNVYVADSGNDRIQKFTSTGTFITKWGSYGADSGLFSSPRSVAVDSLGNVYVTDSSNHRIQKFTSTGTFVTKWGFSGGGSGYLQFKYPLGIAVDTLDNVYVADTSNHRIQKFSSNGASITDWGSSGSGDGQFSYPGGVAVDSSGNVYVADTHNHRIQKFNSNGTFLSKWGSEGSGDGQFRYPGGIAIDSSGNLYVADTYNRIQKFNSNGTFLTKWGSSGSGDGQFLYPQSMVGMAIDSSGNIYVADTYNDRIQKFKPVVSVQTGVISGKVTKADGVTVIQGALVELLRDSVIASSTTTDTSGNYSMTVATGTYDVRASASGYVSQTKTGILVVSAETTTVDVFALSEYGPETYLFETKWGSQGSGDGQFYSNFNIFGITVDSSGNVYASDYDGGRIQKFLSDGTFLTKIGSPGSGDGQLSMPTGVTIDSSGDIYVVNAYNNRIEKFSSNGTFVSKFGTGGYGVAVDSSGYIYVGDTFGYRICKFKPDGTFLKSWGTKGSGDEQFETPRGVAVDSYGNVYVADGGNNRIQKFTSDGVFITKWGTSGTGDGQFSAWGVAVDSLGNVYVADKSNHRIQKFTSNGTFVTKWGSYGSGDGQFNGPNGVAIDSSGNVYVADGGNFRIQKFKRVTSVNTGTISGKVTKSDGSTAIQGALIELLSSGVIASSMTTDTSGNYSMTIATGTYDVRASSSGYQTQTKTGYTVTAGTTTTVNFKLDVEKVGIITTIAGTGTAGYSGDGGQATSAQLNGPISVAIDSYGNLYIADYASLRIRKVSPSGIITTVAGTGVAGYSGDGGQAISAQLYGPISIAIDGSGNLYFADFYNYRIRKVDTSGIITTVAGTGTQGYSGDGGNATSAQINKSYGVALDSSSNLYVADSDNHRIRKVSPSGIITTVAGTGTAGYSGDGGNATSAQLNNPYSVAIDSSGNLYIADYSNSRIRRVSTSGIITTFAGTGSAGYSGDGGSATSAQFYGPYGVVIDSSSNLYIADYGNHRVRKVSTSGIITTIAGTGSAGYSGDGGSAISAQLNYPMGVTVDSYGNLYIADKSNYRIRKVTFASALTGVISGKVTKSDGITAIQGALVELLRSGVIASSTTTSTDGSYQLINLSTGTYDVRFSKAYYATKTVYSVSVGTGTTTLNISLEETHGYLSGTVTKKSDGVTPINGAKVEAYKVEIATPVGLAMTDSGGNYSLYVPTGTYDLVFSAANYSSLSVSDVRVYSSSTTTVNVSLSSIYGTVYGVVKDSATGSPINGATVEALLGYSVIALTVTDTNGSYAITCTSGTYEIRASKKGYISQRKTNYQIFVDSQIVADFYLVTFLPPKVISPSHPSGNIWYANANPTFNWNTLTGAVSYYYLLDESSTTSVSAINGTATTGTAKSYTNVSEGIKYFHLVAVDSEDNLSGQSNYTVRIDTTPPSALTLNSPTHPESEIAYLSKNVKILITPPNDTSGIVGYYYVFDTSSGTVPTTGSSYFTEVVFSTTTFEDGTYFLHLIAKDNADNLSTTVNRIKIKIKTKVFPSEDNTFALSDGTKVEIPAGTLEKENKIEITTPTVTGLVNKGRIKTDIYDEKIKGSAVIREVVLATATVLNKEVTVEIPYTTQEISGLVEGKLKIAHWRGNHLSGLWEIIPSTVYPLQKKVVGLVKEFSIFRIVEYIEPTETISELVNYPNPFVAKRENTKVRYHLKENSEVEIRIYDLIGDLVWEKKISAGESPGGVAGPNEVEWDGRNGNGEYVSAGGYICLLKVGNKVLKRKIGVK